MTLSNNFIHIVTIAYKNYKRANSSLWVTSLCYFSIFSLVPILAILFSFSKWLGIEEYLINQVVKSSPLDLTVLNALLETAQNLLETTRSGLLAGLGFLFLGWSLLSVLSIVEKSFNQIWNITQNRNIFHKFSDYLTIVVLFPIILVSINGLAIVSDLNIIRIVVPYITLAIFFTFFYILIPNTEVKIVPAMISGILTSIIFNQTQLLLIKLQIFINAYNKIYGSFSIILIFLIWLKFIWFLVILGGHLSYFLQNRAILFDDINTDNLSFEALCQLSTIITYILVENYLANKAPISLECLSKTLKLPGQTVLKILNILEYNNIILRVYNKKDEKLYKLSTNVDVLKLEEIKNFVFSYGNNIDFFKILVVEGFSQSDFNNSNSNITFKDIFLNKK